MNPNEWTERERHFYAAGFHAYRMMRNTRLVLYVSILGNVV